MKVVTTIHDSQSLDRLLLVSDGIVIGEHHFGTRLTYPFSADEVFAVMQKTIMHGKACYILANRILEECDLSSFSGFLNRFAPVATGIIIGDVGAFMIMKDLGFAHKAIYDPETLLVNHGDFNMLAMSGALGAFVAREITLAEIIEIARHKAYPLFMVGHGHLGMFYSRRRLVTNFQSHEHLANDLHKHRHLTIREEKRPEQDMPILEDDHGTHVFRGNVLAVIPYLDVLKTCVDVLMIDTIFKDDAYTMRVCPLYREETPASQAIELQKEYHEIWDDGLLFTKTTDKGPNHD